MNKIQEDSSKVCILEVDFEYLEELYDLQLDYLLAPSKSEIKESMLSDYCKKKKSLLNT